MWLFTFLNTRIGRAIALLVLFCIMVLWFNVWLTDQKDEAVALKVKEIKQTTKEEVLKDVDISVKTFDSITDGMRTRANEWVQQYETADGSNRLLGTRGDTASTRTKGRNKGAVYLEGPNLLSDKEIAEIRRYSNLLQ